MIRIPVLVLLTALTTLGVENTDEIPTVSFNKDVLPILQENCQVCIIPAALLRCL
jgi:hypothetical protein